MTKKNFDKIIAHTSFIGTTGYANHSRDFFTALNKLIPVKIRNFTVGNQWTGLAVYPHDKEPYLTNEHKSMLYKQTCIDGSSHKDSFIYDGSPDIESGDNLNIVLNEINHHYFYDKYNGPTIAYNVWESTLYPDDFYQCISGFDYLWVPTHWQKKCSINQGYNANKIKVIPEAIDPSTFYPSSTELLNEYTDERFKFLLFGRWDYRKSTMEIIQTFLNTFKKNEPIDLIVSIDNPFSLDKQQTTEERLKLYNIYDDRIKIKHFPSRSDYIKYLKTGHIFISCARSEGWNLPLIESMACGTPSIYSNWGAQLEFANGKGLPVNIIREKPVQQGSYKGYDVLNGNIPGNYCEPDFNHLSKILRYSYENYKDLKKQAIKDSESIRNTFIWDKIAKKAYNEITNIYNNKNKKNMENITEDKTVIITGADEKFTEYSNICLDEINKNSNLPVYFYGYNFNPSVKNVKTKKIDIPTIKKQSNLHDNTFYYAKINACIDAIENIDSDYYIWLDSDAYIFNGFDNITKYTQQITDHPLFAIYIDDEINQWRLINGIKKSASYGQEISEIYNIKKNINFINASGLFIFNKQCKKFFIDSLKIAKDISSGIHTKLFVDDHAFSEERIFNLLYWKKQYKDFLPITWISGHWSGDRKYKLDFDIDETPQIKKIIDNNYDLFFEFKKRSFDFHISRKDILLFHSTPQNSQDVKDILLAPNEKQELANIKTELYQDQWLNGKIIQKGIRDCNNRYLSIKPILDKYTRQFSILDLGANFGYYSIRSAEDHNSISVMIESETEESKVLKNLCARSLKKDNFTILNTKIDGYKISEIAKCEHFDVVLALNILHHLDEDIEQIFKDIESIGSNLIIEIPPLNDNGTCGKQNVKTIHKILESKDKILLGEFKRHTDNVYNQIYLIKTNNEQISSTYFGYDEIIKNSLFGNDLEKSPLKIYADNKIKKIYNPRSDTLLNFIPGINLKTYIDLNGIYPDNSNLIEKIKLSKISTEYQWDDSNNDISLHNFILKGTDLFLIDFNDNKINKDLSTDKVQLDNIINTLNNIAVTDLPDKLDVKIWIGGGDDDKLNLRFLCQTGIGEQEFDVKITDPINDINLYTEKMILKKDIIYWICPGAKKEYLNGYKFEIFKHGKCLFSTTKNYSSQYNISINNEIIKIKSNPNDNGIWTIFNEIFIQKIYEHPKCPIDHNTTILDIGANYGFFSLYATDKQANKIYAYEPVRDTYNILLENTKKYKNIISINKAIGDQDEEAEIEFSEKSLGTSYIKSDKNPFKTQQKNSITEKIQIKDINTVLLEHKDINFIKIDCEGYEYAIFNGIEESSLSQIKYIVGEYHYDDGFNLSLLLSKLKKSGFQYEINSDGYKNGMFYAWKNDDPILNKKNQTNDDVIIIGSYADTEEKQTILEKCISQLKKTKKDIIISTHYPIPESIAKQVDYIVYDSYNPILHNENSYYFWHDNKDLFVRTKFSNFEGTISHELASLTTLQNGTNLAKSINKKNFYYIEYDNIINDKDIHLIDEIKKNTIEGDKKGYVEKYNLSNEEIGFSLLFMYFDIYFFDDIFDVKRNPDEYISECRQMTGGEYYLYNKFKKYKESLLIGHRTGRGISCFPHSEESLCDCTNVEHIDVLPNKKNNNNIYLFICNEKKHKRKYEIHLNNYYLESTILEYRETYHFNVTNINDVKVIENNKIIFNRNIDEIKEYKSINADHQYIDFKKEPKDKYLISIDSKSLGDNIAWVPYIEEFRKKHNCKVVASTFWNNLFKKGYPEIEFIEPGSVVHNINGQYNIGWYEPWDKTKNPNNYQTIPLQQTASDILGIEFKEIKTKIIL